MWERVSDGMYAAAACAVLLFVLGSLSHIDRLGMATAQQGQLSAAEKKTIEFGLVRLHTLDDRTRKGAPKMLQR